MSSSSGESSSTRPWCWTARRARAAALGLPPRVERPVLRRLAASRCVPADPRAHAARRRRAAGRRAAMQRRHAARALAGPSGRRSRTPSHTRRGGRLRARAASKRVAERCRGTCVPEKGAAIAEGLHRAPRRPLRRVARRFFQGPASPLRRRPTDSRRPKPAEGVRLRAARWSRARAGRTASCFATAAPISTRAAAATSSGSARSSSAAGPRT